MKRTSFLVSLAGIAALTLPLSLVAQEDGDAPPPLSDVWVMVVKPGMMAEFNEAMATHVQFRKDAGESRTWDAFRVAVGHNMTPIGVRSCCFEWADLDVFEAENEALGLTANFNENVGRYVEHFHHYFERSDWANSHWPDTGTGGPYYAVTSWVDKAGSGPEAAAAREAMSQFAKNEGWADEDNNWLWYSRVGGNEITSLVSSYDNYADMAPPEQSFFEYAAEKLGEEEAGKMFKAFGSGFEDSDYTIWKYDESISTPKDEEEDEE